MSLHARSTKRVRMPGVASICLAQRHIGVAVLLCSPQAMAGVLEVARERGAERRPAAAGWLSQAAAELWAGCMTCLGLFLHHLDGPRSEAQHDLQPVLGKLPNALRRASLTVVSSSGEDGEQLIFDF